MLLPYTAQSPITSELKEFNKVDDIYNEIGIIAKQKREDRTLGQDLWYLIPLFANPQYLLIEDYFNLINEYYYCKDYNIPLGKTLDETDATKLDLFTVIKNESAVALNHKAKKDNESKSKH
jgi:hypothetical protein